MPKKIEDILAECIEDVKAGKSSVMDCLNKYPSVRKQLEPLLQLALDIQEPPDIKPSPAFKVRARVQLMEQIHAEKRVTEWPWLPFIHGIKSIAHKRRFNLIAVTVAIVLAVATLGGGTAYASQNSLPGDILYPVKLATEQARLVVSTSDTAKAELRLTFANSRIAEMTALTEKRRPEKINIAVNGYDKAMAMAIEKMEKAHGKGLGIADISEEIASTSLEHLEVLEGVLETAPDEAKPAIQKAIEVSANGQENALRALAGENPVRAMEINLAAMEGRLNRANAKAEKNDIAEVEHALLEFEELHELGAEISEIAQGLGAEEGTAVELLVAEATSHHLEVLNLVLEKVPEQAREAIERAMEKSVRGYEKAVEALEKKGALGDIPEELSLPEGMPDKIKDKLSKPKVPGPP